MWEHYYTTAKGPGLAKRQHVVVCAHARRNLSGPEKIGKFFNGKAEPAAATKLVAK